MSITKIQLYSKQKADYLVVNESIINEEYLLKSSNIDEETGKGQNIFAPSFNPDWSTSFFTAPRIILQFENSVDSSALPEISEEILGFNVFRREFRLGTNGTREVVSYNKVGFLGKDAVGIIDYLIKNNAYYQWVLIPVTESHLGKQSITTDDLEDARVNFETWSVIFLKDDVDSNGKAIHKAENIFIFRCNLQPGSLVQNIDKTQFENYTRYPKFSVGAKNYISGDLSCLLSDVGYRENETEDEEAFRNSQGVGYVYYEEPVYKWEKWNECIASGKDCIIKDDKGHIFYGQIVSNSGTPLGDMKDPPTTISFSFVENDTIDGKLIYDEIQGNI
jgi:hypothetical protein